MEIVRPDGRAERVNAEKSYTRELRAKPSQAKVLSFSRISVKQGDAENLLPDTEQKAGFIRDKVASIP